MTKKNGLRSYLITIGGAMVVFVAHCPLQSAFSAFPHPLGGQELMFRLLRCIISPGWTHSRQGFW
jgi:hypothetical protein